MGHRRRSLERCLGLLNSLSAGTELLQLRPRVEHQCCELTIPRIRASFRSMLIEIVISTVCPGRVPGGSAAHTPDDLLVLLLDDERLAAAHEQNERDEREEAGNVRVHRHSRCPHYSPRIQRMPAITCSRLHDDRHHGQRRSFRLQFGELR